MADERGVGLTSVEGIVSGPSGGPVTVELLVDSGAKYTLLPHAVWTRLGLAPKRTLRVVLADGTTIERKVSECHIALAEGDGHTPVILGEPGDVALLGSVTLEELGLVLYPFDRSLRRSELSMLA
jgi:clan AA aspartic protease